MFPENLNNVTVELYLVYLSKANIIKMMKDGEDSMYDPLLAGDSIYGVQSKHQTIDLRKRV